jgi:hypothetical protein
LPKNVLGRPLLLAYLFQHSTMAKPELQPATENPVDHAGIRNSLKPGFGPTGMLLPVEPAVVPVVALVPLVGTAACVLTRFAKMVKAPPAVVMPVKRATCGRVVQSIACALEPPVSRMRWIVSGYPRILSVSAL